MVQPEGPSSHPEGPTPLAVAEQVLWDVPPQLKDPFERHWQSCSRAVGHWSSSLETGDLTLNGTAEGPEHPCPHRCRMAALLPHPFFRLLYTQRSVLDAPRRAAVSKASEALLVICAPEWHEPL